MHFPVASKMLISFVRFFYLPRFSRAPVSTNLTLQIVASNFCSSVKLLLFNNVGATG